MKPVLLLTGCASCRALVDFAWFCGKWWKLDVLLRFCFLVSPALVRLIPPLAGWVAPEYADVVLMVARDLAMVVERVRVPSSARSSWRCVVVWLLHIWVMYCTGLRLFSLCLFFLILSRSCGRVIVSG